MKESSDKKPDTRTLICSLLIMITASATDGILIYIIKSSVTGLIRNVITGLVMSGVLLFVIFSEKKDDSWGIFDNSAHFGRFTAAYIISAVLSGLSSLLPEFCFLIAAIGVITALLSDLATGTVSYIIISAAPLLINGGSFEYFLYYFLSGMVLIVLMLKGNSRFAVKKPMLIYVMISAVSYMSLIVLKRSDITPAVIINPCVGIVLNIIILIIAFRLISINIVFRYRERSIETVDPEYHLLMDLKKEDPYEFKRAIHTAYLCDRLADRLSLDRISLKGAGFYHRIGVISDDTDTPLGIRTINMLTSDKIPPAIIRIVEEYCSPGNDNVSAEASVLMITDDVINTILGLYGSNTETVDYDKVIDDTLSSLMDGGDLKNSELTFSEINVIRKHLKEEKLFYDFLR